MPWFLCPVETKIREKQAHTCSPGTVILTLAAVSSWCKARDSIIFIVAPSSEQLSASKGNANSKLYLLQLKLLLWSFKASQQLETLTGDNTFYVCGFPVPAQAWGTQHWAELAAKAAVALASHWGASVC